METLLEREHLVSWPTCDGSTTWPQLAAQAGLQGLAERQHTPGGVGRLPGLSSADMDQTL